MNNTIKFRGSTSDARKEYFADIKERRGQASGAKRKKNGSKSKSCKLPSDGMTRKEWEKRNGPVIIFATNIPTDYTTLCDQSVDIQREYINGLLNRFNIPASKIAEMLGVSPSTCLRYVRKLNINYAPHNLLRVTKGEKGAWNYFLSQVDWPRGYYIEKQTLVVDTTVDDTGIDNEEPVQKVVLPTLVEDAPETPATKENRMTITINYTGDQDLDLLHKVLEHIKDLDVKVKLNLHN